MSETRSTAATRARRETEIRALMAEAFRQHKTARDALSARLSEGLLLNAFAVRPVLRAQGDMLPWARVNRAARDGNLGVYNAMLEVRQMCVQTLLSFGEASSTDLIALDVDRVERDGMRRFVKATARFISPAPTGTTSVARGTDVDDVVTGETKMSETVAAGE